MIEKYINIFAVIALLSQFCASASALPIFSRRYDVPCETCHTVAPQLNRFGLAFQASHFNWPDASPPANHNGLNAVPVSGLVASSSFHDITNKQTTTQFNTLELFASNGYTVRHSYRGGYFVDYFAAVNGGGAGDLEDAYVNVPITADWSVTGGQFTPVMYQYDPVTNLTQSLPAALVTGIDGVSMVTASPGIRLEYGDRHKLQSADGNYASIGIPYEGHLTLNRDSQWHGPHGVYLHAFHRSGETSYGVYGYHHDNAYMEGVIGTSSIGRNLQVLAAFNTGHDLFGNSNQFSLQADYKYKDTLALSARLEAVQAPGFSDTYPIVAITYYPFYPHLLRLVGETIQATGSRSSTVYAFVQF